MERKIVVICIAAVLTGLLTVQGQHVEGLWTPQEITEEQALRECAGLAIRTEEIEALDRVWTEQTGYQWEALRAADCAALGGPGAEGEAQRLAGPDGTASDWLFVRCRSEVGGTTYERLGHDQWIKTVRPAARDVIYHNDSNAAYIKYTVRPIWPWTDA